VYLVELGNDVVLLFRLNKLLVGQLEVSFLRAQVFGLKPALEDGQVGEDVRQQVVEQRPQLLQVVLHWSSSQDHPALGLEQPQLPV